MKEKMMALVGKEMSYKKMCLELGEEYYTGGNQKNAQLARWMQYAEIEISKHPTKFVIKQVYNEPIILPDDRSRFIKYMESLIINYMAETDTNELVTTKQNLLESLAMVNSNFTFMRKENNRAKLANHDIIGLDENSVEELSQGCFIAAQSVLLPWLDSALKSMRRKSIVTFADGYVIVYNENGVTMRKRVLAVNDKKSDDWKLSEKIQQAYKDVYADLEKEFPSIMRYSNGFMFSWMKKIEEQRVLSLLKDDIPEIKHIYKCIVLHSTEPIIKGCASEAKKIINMESKRKLRNTVAFKKNNVAQATVSRLLSECIDLMPTISYEQELNK